MWTTYDDSRFKKTTNRYYVNVFSNLCIKFDASELQRMNSHAFQTFLDEFNSTNGFIHRFTDEFNFLY